VNGAFLGGEPNALVSSSNIGQPGRWVFTVRGDAVVTPPPPGPPVGVPELAALGLLGLGLVGLAAVRRRAD